jgi:2'-5' RNA ligase
MQNMMLRSFIAVEIPAEIRQAIARSTASLQKSLPKPLVRWISLQNIHLTLQFLGDVSPSNLERLAEVLKAEAAAHAPIEVLAAKSGAFPTPRRARVIWIGLEAPAALSTLQRVVEAVTARLGYPSEERKFSPHLTIGRVNQNASAADLQKIYALLQQTDVGVLGWFRVDAIHIFKSDLHPSGPVYTRLYTLPLNAGA